MRDIKDRLNLLYNRASETEGKTEESENTSGMRSKLERLYSKERVKYFPKTELEKKSQHLDDVVPGSWINTNFGDVFRGEFEYDIDELYGDLNLREIFDFREDDYKEHFQIENFSSPRSLLFADTETTGLAGGSGTVAFMVGVGWLEQEKFVVHQYFLTRLDHEEGMLDLLQQLIKKFECLVTFNGKSYDIPLLNTRFLMNRLSEIPDNYPHIDLLHKTRALWKYSLDNCKLQSVESDLLKLNRDKDIPGELIPDIYFNYLNSGLLNDIEEIFFHNRYDIITMLANLILVMKSMGNTVPENNPLDDYAKGRIFNRKKDINRSILHYKNVLNAKISDSRRQKTLLELAQIYKQERQYAEAVKLWESALLPKFPFALIPYVELAKYFEHSEKNYEKALELSKKVLSSIPAHRFTDIDELKKRIERLNKKIIKQKEK